MGGNSHRVSQAFATDGFSLELNQKTELRIGKTEVIAGDENFFVMSESE
jgi:hypothetical protein